MIGQPRASRNYQTKPNSEFVNDDKAFFGIARCEASLLLSFRGPSTARACGALLGMTEKGFTLDIENYQTKPNSEFVNDDEAFSVERRGRGQRMRERRIRRLRDFDCQGLV